jgi:hypothetical protein
MEIGFEFSMEHLNGKIFSEFCEYCGHRLHVVLSCLFLLFYVQRMLHLASSFTKIRLSRLFLIRECTLKSKEITIERGTSGSISLKFSRAPPVRHSFIHVISVFLSRLTSWFISEHSLQWTSPVPWSRVHKLLSLISYYISHFLLCLYFTLSCCF